MNNAIEPVRTFSQLPHTDVQESSSPNSAPIGSTEPNFDIELRKPYFEWESISLLGQAAFPAIVLVWAVAAAHFFRMGDMRSNPHDVAYAQIHGPLTQACQAYFIKNEKWPASLEVLLDRDPHGQVYLDKRDCLIDPWENQYRYDPKGPMNQGVKPDIWTITPRGQVIGNWTKLNANPR